MNNTNHGLPHKPVSWIWLFKDQQSKQKSIVSFVSKKQKTKKQKSILMNAFINILGCIDIGICFVGLVELGVDGKERLILTDF